MSTSSESADVVICGGAAIGSSVAYHLAADPGFKGKVVVIEKDPTYRYSASALSAASIRQQFSSAVNIRISLFGVDFLRDIGAHLAVDGEVPAIDLHEGGYLYLAGEGTAPILAANQKLQAAEGADIALYAAELLRSKFSWLNTSDLACGTFGVSGEGWFDGWACCRPFARRHAVSASNIGRARSRAT
jgi:FAD-dependent oxidoreductase domain-containing protein 1